MNKKPFLTVFTPTLNRKELLERSYRTLCRQTNKDFEWIIVDDGSTDGTWEQVESWCENENGFPIRYVWKDNGGLHTGYNMAIAMAEGELAVCVDSDDYLPDDAVQLIYDCWQERGGEQFAGIIGLKYSVGGELLWEKLPDQNAIDLIDWSYGSGSQRRGDKKLVVRSELYNKVAPLQGFPGEKYFNPHYMHLQIAKNYEFLVLNTCILVGDYLPTGMGANMYKQYKNSPNSFLERRKLEMSFPGSLKRRLRTGVHFVSSAILAHRFWREFMESKDKGILLLCFLPGILLSALVLIKG